MAEPSVRSSSATAAGPDAADVQVSGITKTFDGESLVLDGVDVSVDSGATLALLGPSGCGKTTLLRIIAGLEVPDRGTVVLGGRTLTGPGVTVPPERRRVGMVFQDWALFPHLSVGRNVGFGLPRAERKVSPRIDEALELVGLSGMADRMPSTLSGGQQQRVALARAIAPRPSALLLDEPFSNLDAALRVQVRTEIHQLLVGLGITTVFVTHDQDEAFVLGDRVAVLAGGKVVQVGSPASLYSSPATRWLAGFVGEANFVRAVEVHDDRAETVLGAVPLSRARTGAAAIDVLVRPEEIEIEPWRAGAVGIEAQVELVEFVGHDTTYLVRAEDTELRVRRASLPVLARGDRALVRYGGGPATWFDVESEPSADRVATDSDE